MTDDSLEAKVSEKKLLRAVSEFQKDYLRGYLGVVGAIPGGQNIIAYVRDIAMVEKLPAKFQGYSVTYARWLPQPFLRPKNLVALS